MFNLALREAIIKKITKKFHYWFSVYFYFFSFFLFILQKTGTKKGFQGEGVPPPTSVRFTPKKVFVLFPYFHTSC